ncbi:DUF1353 domain-containing protein [Ancylobacter sp. A5.8]|uniref:DUF1353 domain-containing protein n=1 Tax=Ancylobacter gelatini TaxID=2919920 RepID=UPI001F4E524B|nr:DUF1353 domain-containing protein [Ancylobacter gelatini]MCJ8142657.1 DUF1353 domain-containing protein [Ancylobacter gelatini]
MGAGIAAGRRGRCRQIVSRLALAAALAVTAASCSAARRMTPAPDPTVKVTPRLSGRVTVEWAKDNRFIFRPGTDSLTFRSSGNKTIKPGLIYTDGGSIPQVLQGVPGLSPWGLGPAYVIHDWLFYLHRCGTPEQRDAYTFLETADILEEVAVELRKAGLAPNSERFIPAISRAVRGWTARKIWNRKPGTECDLPGEGSVLDKTTRQLKDMPAQGMPPALRDFLLSAEPVQVRRLEPDREKTAPPPKGKIITDFVIPNY